MTIDDYTIDEIIEEREQLRARVAALEAALRRMLELFGGWPDTLPLSSFMPNMKLVREDIAAAREALAAPAAPRKE